MPYTLRVRDQIVPKYLVRKNTGTGKEEYRLNAGEIVVNPQSFVRLVYTPLTKNPQAIYEVETAGRMELWEDVNGTATWSDIKAQIDVIGYLQSIIKLEAKGVIEKKWPLWAQNNCALGIYSAEVIGQCTLDIVAVINASNAAEDLVSNATSTDAALAVKATWPVL